MPNPLRSLVILTVLSCPVATAHAQSLAYTANSCSNDVSVIDVAAKTVVATVPLDASPKGVAVSPDGTRAFIVDAGATRVWVIDTASQDVVKTIRLGADAGIGDLQAIAIAPDGAYAYVPRANAQRLAVIDLARMRVVANVPLPGLPEGLVIDPTGAFAYVAVGAQYVAVVDLAARALVATIDLGFSRLGPTDLAVTPNGDVVFVATQNWYLKALDTKTNALIDTLTSASGDFFGVAVAPDGTRVYATDFFAPAVLVFDAATHALLRTIPLTSRPRDIAITPDGALALIPGEFNVSPTGNDVTVIDTARHTVVGRIDIGCRPVAIAITPDLSPVGRLTRLTEFLEGVASDLKFAAKAAAKLVAALDAIDAGRRKPACAKLQDFVHQVSKKADKKLSSLDTDWILAEANDIRSTLACR